MKETGRYNKTFFVLVCSKQEGCYRLW